MHIFLLRENSWGSACTKDLCLCTSSLLFLAYAEIIRNDIAAHRQLGPNICPLLKWQPCACIWGHSVILRAFCNSALRKHLPKGQITDTCKNISLCHFFVEVGVQKENIELNHETASSETMTLQTTEIIFRKRNVPHGIWQNSKCVSFYPMINTGFN